MGQGWTRTLQELGYQKDTERVGSTESSTSLTDQSFTFNASEAQYTTKVLEFTAPSRKTQDFMISIYNPSTENALKVQVKNMIASFNSITRPAKITDINVAAQTRSDPAYVQYYDASGASYSNLTTAFTNATANDVAVPGHAEAEVGDILYIGAANRFRRVYFNVGTAKTDVSTLVWEYWDGDSWETLTDLTDGTVAFTATAGVYELAFNPPIAWAKTAVNSQTYYWIRCRCTAFTSAGTAGAITQGKIVDNYYSDITSEPVYGLFNGANTCRLVISNQTASVGASQTIAGAGAFTGHVRITPLI